MPDLEMPLRSLRLHVERKPSRRALLKMYYRGLDHGRWSCLSLFIILFILAVLIGIEIT